MTPKGVEQIQRFRVTRTDDVYLNYDFRISSYQDPHDRTRTSCRRCWLILKPVGRAIRSRRLGRPPGEKSRSPDGFPSSFVIRVRRPGHHPCAGSLPALGQGKEMPQRLDRFREPVAEAGLLAASPARRDVGPGRSGSATPTESKNASHRPVSSASRRRTIASSSGTATVWPPDRCDVGGGCRGRRRCRPEPVEQVGRDPLGPCGSGPFGFV